ncbi:MAG: 16S rRNA (uracil(1498)-N(3))-methyltransferase [Salinibacter sp.]
MTTNFYAPPPTIRGRRVVLPADEARHVRTVLRGEEGDEIAVVDGEGGWYRTRLDHVAPEQVVGTIVEEREEVGEPAVHVTVALGLLKKRSRFETFVEKAVELGVRRLVPLRTRRTERDSIRKERLHNVMVAAMKQCRRSRLPGLGAPQSLASVLADSAAEMRLVCHAGAETVPIRRAVARAEPVASALVLVGPEGGFASSEVDEAVAAGCTPVSLGPRRLRAETAGLAALHAVVSGTEEREGPN